MGVLLLSFKAMVRMGCFWWAGMAGMPSAKVVEVEAEPMEGCYDGPSVPGGVMPSLRAWVFSAERPLKAGH